MQDDVNRKLEQFMEVIRASVRHFRYNLDDMLNKLRGSNASFRKSIKIFSEGGNFSPDEVEEFRKRFEKMATRIDMCEGNIMGDLEGLETKRMDTAKEYAGKLEDRFKQHLFDLTFIEKIKRWLTNIQVKIKGEVANSNSQSQHLSKMISVFSTKLKLIKNPHVDAEKCTAEDTHETLVPILQSFRDRMNYLNCGVKTEQLSTSSLESMVKISADRNRNTPGSRNSKGKKLARRPSVKNKRTSNLSQASTNQSTSSPVNDTNANEEIIPSAPTVPKPTTGYGTRRNSGVRTALGGKYDKKYLVFGDINQEAVTEQTETHFLATQVKILQSGLDGLLSTAELYYRQKGQRAPTRAQSINESFDACAESLIQRLRKYKAQTESYHNDCVQEFRAQIKLFNSELKELPPLLMVSLVIKQQNTSHGVQEELKTTLEQMIKSSEMRKKEHKTLLRPTLGHPNNKPELENLRSSEQSRQQEYANALNDYERLMVECENLSAKSFLKELVQLVSLFLSQFDIALSLDEVILGEFKPKMKTEKELLRGKETEAKKKEEEKNDYFRREVESPYTWPNLDLTSITNQGVSLDENFVSRALSLKFTELHKMVIEARDKEFKNFFETRKENLAALENACAQMRTESTRWENNWQTSLDKITKLY